MKRQVFLSVYNLIKFYSSEDLSHSPAMVCQKPDRDKTISWNKAFDPKLTFLISLHTSPPKISLGSVCSYLTFNLFQH